MKDPRMTKLAENLVRYSCQLRPGEKVLIETFDCPDFVAEALVRAAYEVGARPFFQVHRTKIERQWLLGADRQQIEQLAAWDAARMSEMDAYISLRGNDNFMENADIPPETDDLYQSIYFKKVHHEIRVAKTKWCVLRYPSPSMAQLSGMSTEAFEDFYFDVCNLDYGKMDRAMDPLKELMISAFPSRALGPSSAREIKISRMGKSIQRRCGTASTGRSRSTRPAAIRDSRSIRFL